MRCYNWAKKEAPPEHSEGAFICAVSVYYFVLPINTFLVVTPLSPFTLTTT